MSSLGLGCPAATDLTLVAVPDSFGDPVDRPFGALFPIVAETLTGWIFVANVIRFDGGGECLGGNTLNDSCFCFCWNTKQVQKDISRHNGYRQ